MEGNVKSPERTSLEALIALTAPRCSSEELEEIRQAYALAEEAHGDQKRSSGEPYITHPLAVATILAQLNLDANTIIAALLLRQPLVVAFIVPFGLIACVIGVFATLAWGTTVLYHLYGQAYKAAKANAPVL